MTAYEVFGARLTSAQGYKLGVVGLCRAEKRQACEARLNALEDLCMQSEDPTEIDRSLAERLTMLFSGLALAIGATLYMQDISNRVYRTGGVLGRPEADSEDAENELEQLDTDIWMYTISGGPGWIGFFSREKAERLAGETYNHSVVYPAKVNEIYRRLIHLSPDAYLFVSDGTGYDSFGLCAAKCGARELCFFV